MTPDMRYAIIGAGGIGGYLAAKLAAAGADVAVLARGAHLAAIRDQGLTLRDTDGEITVHPAVATDDGEALGAADVAVFAVKGQDGGHCFLIILIIKFPNSKTLIINGYSNFLHELFFQTSPF